MQEHWYSYADMEAFFILERLTTASMEVDISTEEIEMV